MTAEKHRLLRRLVLAGFSYALFVASLKAPALRFVVNTGEDRTMVGWELLLLGWYGLVQHSNVGWLANLAYLPSVTVMIIGLRWVSFGLAVFAILLGLHSLALLGVTFDADEAGVKHMVLTHFESGFYLWMAAMAMVIPAAFLGTARIVPKLGTMATVAQDEDAAC